MVNRQEIDLIIRAQLKGQNSFTGVAKAINQLSKDIDSQVAAAKRGEVGIDELKASLLALQQAQESLKDQAGLIAQFNKTSQAVAALESKLDKARTGYDEYRAKLGDIDKATDKQVAKLDKLGDAVKRAEAAYAGQTQQQRTLKASLDEVGIALTKEADAENKLRQNAAELGLSINKVQQSIKSYAVDLQAAKAAERQLAAGNFLRKMADDAVSATKGFTTLNRAIKQTPVSGNLRAAVEDILDPANRVRATLGDVSEQVNKVEADFKKGAISADRMAEAIRTVRNLQSRLVTQSGLVEDYAAQAAKLREARAEYSRTRTAVLELAEAVRLSKDRNAELEAKLRSAQTAYAAARTAMGNQVTTLRALRTELEQAGIKTNDLAGAQQRITQTATRTVSVLNQLRSVTQSAGRELSSGGLNFDRFNDSGRTTLSLTQRIKGEFLALGSAYLGVFGIINNGGKVLDAFNKRQAIQNQLSIAVGNDQRAIAEEYAYATSQAERLGVEFTSLASGYAKFLAGGSQVGRTRQELRFIFEAFTEVGRVANLTEDDLNGIFKALEQIVSKGKVQSEELRGQLGDRLFGAFGVAQRALEEKFGKNLDKALKDGKVLASDLVEIAEEYRKIVADQLPGATQSMQAEQARLNSEIFNFKLLIADSGFADAYKELVKDLIAFFKSSDGKQFAEDLASAFKGLVSVTRLLLENIGLVKAAVVALVGITGVRFLSGAVIGTAKFWEATRKAATATKALGDTASVTQRILSGVLTWLSRLNVLILGFSIGYFFYNQIPQFKEFVDGFIGGLDRIWERIKKAYKESGILKGIWEGMLAAGDELANRRNNRETQMVIDAQNARKAAIEAQLKAGNKDFTRGNFTTKVPLTDLDRTKLNAELRVIKEAEARRAKANAPAAVKDDTPVADVVTDKPDATPTSDPEADAKAAEKAAKAAEKRKRLEQALADELMRLEERVTKKTAESLAEREAAIENSYGVLLRKIQAFYGKDSEMEKRLDAAKEALIAEEREKAADERLKMTESVIGKIETLEATAGRKEKLSLDARLAAIVKANEDAYRDIEKLRKKLSLDGQSTAEADAAKKRLDAAVAELQVAERKAFYQDELERREKALNDLLAERSAKLESIEVLKDTGLISDLQARERAAEVIASLESGIQSITEESLKWAEANRAALDPAQAARFAAEMIKARESAKGLRTELFTARSLAENVSNGASNAFSNSAAALGEAAVNTRSWSDALKEVRNQFLRFAADFLREIAVMIAKQALLNELQKYSGSNGFLGGLAGILNGVVGGAAGGATASSAGSILGTGAQSFVIHSGGVVNGTLNRKRTNVDPSMFVSAPRYHQGGIPGLAPNEYPAILEKNEEVLSKDNPRNILNGGGDMGGAQASPPTPINVFNTIDQDSFANAMFTGERAKKGLVNVIRADVNTFKTILGI